MNADQWNRAMELVPDALALPAEERPGFLDRRCRFPNGDVDADLRTEIEKLIAASDAADASDAMKSPVEGVASMTAEMEGLEPLSVPERIGPWRPIRRLGSGGMGVVYEAERVDESFKQKSALKLIRAGFVDDFRDRFIRERAVLARLSHPGIARLLDGGLTPDGTPYLAMELVEGRPLTKYATENRLTTRDRLGLFVDVCDAVSYAHRNLVVHRDLKPANIFVHEKGQTPAIKLLDFGVAKLIGDEDSLLTRQGIGPLTPAFAAPEQLTGESITTATDVYALGVVLYTLLSGERPYDLEDKTASQAELIVCTENPLLPSLVAADADQRAELRGDLDQIILKALHKDPARRYGSAQALGEDISRFLNSLPVHAQKDALAYRFRKFVQRNRTAVIAASCGFLFIVVLVSAFTIGLARERDRAEAAASEASSQAERATAIAGFLGKILSAPNERWYNENRAGGPETPVRVVLSTAASQIDSEFADRPDLAADLHHIIGDTYMALGLGTESAVHHRRTLELRAGYYQPPHPKIAEALYYAAASTPRENMYDRISLLDKAIDMQRLRNEGNNFPFMIQEFTSILINVGDLPEAVRLNREAIEYVDRTFRDNHDGNRYRIPLGGELSRQRAAIEIGRGDLPLAGIWLKRADSLRKLIENPSAAPILETSIMCTQGELFEAQKRFQEAEATLLTCLGDLRRPNTVSPERASANPPVLSQPIMYGRAAAELVDLYASIGISAAAGRYQAEADAFRTDMGFLKADYHKWKADRGKDE